jgi:hypothetical protein
MCRDEAIMPGIIGTYILDLNTCMDYDVAAAPLPGSCRQLCFIHYLRINCIHSAHQLRHRLVET